VVVPVVFDMCLAAVNHSPPLKSNILLSASGQSCGSLMGKKKLKTCLIESNIYRGVRNNATPFDYPGGKGAERPILES
jgi:hypothetical protein